MAALTAATLRELADLSDDLRPRVRDLIRASPRPLGIRSAWRSRAEQQRLYDGWKRRLPGFNPANPPGKSKHERTSPPGEQPPAGRAAADAADLTLSTWDQWAHVHAHEFGLHFPIQPNRRSTSAARRRGEPWHVESNGRPYKPKTAPAAPEEEIVDKAQEDRIVTRTAEAVLKALQPAGGAGIGDELDRVRRTLRKIAAKVGVPLDAKTDV